MEVHAEIAGLNRRSLLPLAAPNGGKGPAVACTLAATDQRERLAQWQRVLTGARRTPIEGGLRLHLDERTDVAELVGLVAAERGCCSFSTSDVHLGEETVLEVRAPAHTRELLDEVFTDRP